MDDNQQFTFHIPLKTPRSEFQKVLWT